MATALYIVSPLTTLFCAILLLRGYATVHRRLLLWSGLCFIALTISNIFKILDLIFLPRVDLFTYRLASDAVAMVLLLYGLIWESE